MNATNTVVTAVATPARDMNDWGGRRFVPRLCSLEFDVLYHGAEGAGRGGLLLASIGASFKVYKNFIS